MGSESAVWRPGSIVQTTTGEIGVYVGSDRYYGPTSKHDIILTLANKRVYFSIEKEITEFTPTLLRELHMLLPNMAYVVGSNRISGTDPEVFAFTKAGKVIPAWDYLTEHKGPGIYWDGVQAEFTVQPKSCHNELTDGMHARLRDLLYHLRQHDSSAVLRAQDVVKLSRSTLMTADDDKIILGCSPSMNAYPGIEPIRIEDPRSHPYRYAGTHIHLSAPNHPLPKHWPEGTVAMIDRVAGPLMTALGRDMEDPERRKAYGRAGEYRLPEGSKVPRLEWRVPGAYLMHHPALFNFVADAARHAFRMGLYMDGRELDIPDTQGIINSCDADSAWKLIEQHKPFFNTFVHALYYYTDPKYSLNIVKTGAKASGLFNGTLEANWLLDSGGWSTNNGSGRTRWQNILNV